MKNSIDRTKLRENDIPYVNEVIGYLIQKKLNVGLRGSASYGDKEYRDVDLLAEGHNEAVAAAEAGLVGSLVGAEQFPKKSADGLEYSIKKICGYSEYVDEHTNSRFKIQVGKTQIDLSFKVCLIPPKEF